MNERQLDEWHFDFGLQQGDNLIPESKCMNCLTLIIEWAERNGLGIGGGFRRIHKCRSC